MVTVPTGTMSAILANVGDQLADPETLVIVAAAIGLPLVFWLIARIKGAMPTTKK